MRIGVPAWVAVVTVCACADASSAKKWRWPDSTTPARIDNKVHFIDADHDRIRDENPRDSDILSDEAQFEEPTNTEGFYNRPPGVGRYPVHVETHRAPYRVDPHSVYHLPNTALGYSDGTLDSLQFCKCVFPRTLGCNPSADSAKACGAGKYLCCYPRPNKKPAQASEYFNEVLDERPVLVPGNSQHAGPFPAPPGTALDGTFGPGHGHEAALLGAVGEPGAPRRPVLVGPGGPTGLIGPNDVAHIGDRQTSFIESEIHNQGILVGPSGPTGSIGPVKHDGVLLGPGGPTGTIGPTQHNKQQFYQDDRKQELGPSESAQRGVLVGPGGPTGIIGPRGFGRRPVLVGPGGPTGIIGPYGRVPGPPLLIGPGGPTGVIGPSRRPYYGK